ncbi:MAG: hypothetical protein ABSH50_31350 [Bryobacteraceae bacterium]|jgi:hypothetical protein
MINRLVLALLAFATIGQAQTTPPAQNPAPAQAASPDQQPPDKSAEQDANIPTDAKNDQFGLLRQQVDEYEKKWTDLEGKFLVKQKAMNKCNVRAMKAQLDGVRSAYHDYMVKKGEYYKRQNEADQESYEDILRGIADSDANQSADPAEVEKAKRKLDHYMEQKADLEKIHADLTEIDPLIASAKKDLERAQDTTEKHKAENADNRAAKIQLEIKKEKIEERLDSIKLEEENKEAVYNGFIAKKELECTSRESLRPDDDMPGPKPISPK